MTDVLRRGRASLAFSFFAQGATFALLVTRIPAIQDRYGVSDALLPVFLAAVPILAGVGSVTTEQLVKRIRPSRLLRWSQPVVLLALLGAASIVTWTMLLAKAVELLHANRTIQRGMAMAEADAPDSDKKTPHPLQVMREAVHAELAASHGAQPEGTKDRLASRLHRLEMRLARQAQRGTGILATIGATSPFVGLFGTVWGIMNSFVGIARLHTTNLAVVAPGIAEALLATALGLVAAIPAVMIYNMLARSTAQYRALLGDASAQVMKLVSRDLDRAKLPLSQAAE